MTAAPDDRPEAAGEAPGAPDPAAEPARTGDLDAAAATDGAGEAGERAGAAAEAAPSGGLAAASDEPAVPSDDPAAGSDAPAARSEPAGASAGRPVSAEELGALQAAEDAKQGDPELDEVDAADIEVRDDKEEPFEKLAASARRLSADRARTIVETLLFLADRPLSPEELRQATGLEVGRIEKALDQLSGHYREGPCGIVLHEVAGGWQLRTSPDNADFARRFLRVKPQRLTRAALETLAIIAYRQPVTRPEIEDIRGVDCGAVVKALLERRLIKILGKKEEPGRPILYGTTREFLEFFALKDLASLPTLREFHELSEEHRDIVEKEAPEQASPGIAGIVEELSDPRLRAELEAKRAEGDAALDELERAMAAADDRTRAAEAALAEKKADDADPDADPTTPPAGG